MKDIFRKIGQSLSSLATEFPARQETLASAKEESGINRGAELASPTEVGLASAQAPSTRKSFAFMEAAKESQDASPRNSDATENASRPHVDDRRPQKDPADPARLKKPTLLPGSDGEHALQVKYGAKDRALGFYGRQVLSFLSPLMRDFISRQEFLFVATADRHGECDCTSKFGEPGFIRALSEKYLAYPEYRGNGVFANLGNISENPHIAMLILDFFRDSVGLHVNGKARIIENEELSGYADKIPQDILDELAKEGKRRPERWVMVEVEEAYIQCSKHVPLLQKRDRKIDWGTDSVAAKKGDYFQLQDIPLYDRVGGDNAMEVAVDVFYRKVLEDDLVGRFFDGVDMEGLRLKQKSFLAMAFGGPYRYTSLDLRKAHGRLVQDMGLNDQHFDRVAGILKETLVELEISAKEIDEMMLAIESARDDILNR
jgi:truncated hemoglobin YjbI